MMNADMLVEEVEIVLKTGCCPRCNGEIEFSIDDDGDWDGTCKLCHTSWGGFG